MTPFTQVTQKIAMALSGLFLIIFLIGHLLGNLQIFLGQDAMNAYGVLLRQFPTLLWTFRLLTLSAFSIHVLTAINLAKSNQKARGTPYAVKQYRATSFASRTLLWGGLMILFFVLYHLAHLTWGLLYPEHAAMRDSLGRHDIYSQVILGFQQPVVLVLYLIAQVCLGFHLSHGFASAFQTLGLTCKSWYPKLRKASVVFAILLCSLYSAIPLSVVLGCLHL